MIRRLDRILSDLVGDAEQRERRHEMAAALGRAGTYVDDSLGTYIRMEAMHSEAEEVWKSREWFRRLYEQYREAQMLSTGSSDLPADESEARRKLQEIYQMRSWKLIQRYRHFMDETRLGRILSRIRDLFRR